MKTISCLIGVLTFLTATAFGQQKIALSATVAPLYEYTSYNRLSLYPDSDGQVVEPIFLSGKRHSFGYEAGLTFRYTYAPGWSVGSGLWYRQLNLEQPRLAEAGEGTTSLKSRAVRIPLLLNYQSATRRLSPYFTLGVLLDFPLASRVVVTRAGESTQRLRLDAGSGPVFLALLGAGGQYQLTNRYSLLVQPTVSYNMGRFGGGNLNNPAYELGILTQLVHTF